MRSLTIHRLLPAAALALFAGSAIGQSVNVDVNRSTSTVVPANTFAGAAGQPGLWNSIIAGTSGSVALTGLDGLSTNLTVTRGGQGSGDATTISGASADFGTLMSDYQTISTTVNSGPEYTVNGLTAGFYRVTVYASLPGASGYWLDQFSAPVYYNNYISLTLGGSPAGSDTTSGPLVANTFADGVTHAVFNLAIPAGAPALKIAVKTGFSTHERCALNGFQITKYPGNRLYVDSSRINGGKNGLSWTDAFTDLQDALQAARQSNGVITDIWVARGTYKPSASDRTRSFDLVSGVKLRGHFAGTETSPAQRDFSDASNTTYLTGDIGTVRYQPDNTFHVITATDVSSSTYVDGFFITNGLANGNIQTGQQDGALAYLQNSSPQFRNCEFTNGDNSYRGGAVYANLGGPSFANCSFSDNGTGLEGGAIFWTSGTAAGSPQLKVFNCEFRGNMTGGYGSAILCEGGYAQVVNSLFNGMSGHGVCYVYKTTPNSDGMELINCTFTNNMGSVFGTSGGAYQSFKNCIIWGNHHYNFPSGQLAQSGWGSSLSQNCFVNLTTIQGYNSSLVPGPYNNGLDPQFVSLNGADGLAGTWDDNLHLGAASPVIDAGHNSYLPTDACDVDWDANTSEVVPSDLDGQARLFNVPYIADTGFGSGAIVDRGCYEAQFTTPPCGSPDFNCDGDVGTDADIEAFFACLAGTCPGSPCMNTADFNADGDIGTDADIEAFFRVLAGGAC